MIIIKKKMNSSVWRINYISPAKLCNKPVEVSCSGPNVTLFIHIDSVSVHEGRRFWGPGRHTYISSTYAIYTMDPHYILRKLNSKLNIVTRWRHTLRTES